MNNNDSTSQTREVQLAILKVAKEVHKICEENNIEYCMLGGTFIGAIRHKGFIPWDDDIDFGMTWPNYKKFIEILKTMNHPWMTYDIPNPECKEYAKLFVKVYDKNTTFVELQRDEADAKGVFVDIFPISYIGNTIEEARASHRKHNFYRAMLDRKKYVLFNEFQLKDRLFRVLSKIFSFGWLIKQDYKFYEKRNARRTEFSGPLDGTKKDWQKTSFYEKPYVLYPFEDTEFYGVADYHEYLTAVFKDYMKLPPVEQQVSHHLTFCDLNLPYEKYLENLRAKK